MKCVAADVGGAREGFSLGLYLGTLGGDPPLGAAAGLVGGAVIGSGFWYISQRVREGGNNTDTLVKPILDPNAAFISYGESHNNSMRELDKFMIPLKYDTSKFEVFYTSRIKNAIFESDIDTSSTLVLDVASNLGTSIYDMTRFINNNDYAAYRDSIFSNMNNPTQSNMLRSLLDRIYWCMANDKESNIPAYISDYRSAIQSESSFSSQTRKQTLQTVSILEASYKLWKLNLN